MKKFGILFLLTAVLLGLGLNSCDKDSFTEEDALNLQAQIDKQKQSDNDSLNVRNQRVTYTINLVDASTSTLKSGSMVSAVTGAVVKFVQDTNIIIHPADASGIVTFSNLKPGNANINITLDGFSEVNYTVNLSSSTINGGRQVSNIIPLIPIAGTSTGVITGKVTYETNLTNNAPEVVPQGTKVIAMVDVNSDALVVPTSNNNIVSISYDKLSLTATTDASGNFSMTVPATVLGLDYDIFVSDFTADQKLLMTTYNSRDTSGVLTIPTNFGTSFQNASSVSTGTPVIVTISAPDYTFTPATATAVIDNNKGISYIQNTNVGSYYSDWYDFSTTIDNPTTGGSKATVNFSSYNGHITQTVYIQGTKYPSDFNGKAVTIPYIRVAAKAIVDAVNASGAISSYHVVNNKNGEFFSVENLQFVKHTGAGTGTITNLPGYIYNNSGKYLYFSNGTRSLSPAVGSGFAAGDSLVLTVNAEKNDVYTGKMFLTTGRVSAINITNEGSNYISGKVDVVISSPSVGSPALAYATVNHGRISQIILTDNGTGYSEVPIVTIKNKAEKTQAKAYAVMNNGQVERIELSNPGNGYLSVPNVLLTSSIPGVGTGASAYAILRNGEVDEVVVVNKGNGYRGNIPSFRKDYDGASSVTVKGSTSSIVNIDLGTGKRSVEF